MLTSSECGTRSSQPRLLHVIGRSDSAYGGPVSALALLLSGLPDAAQVHVASLASARGSTSPLSDVLPGANLHLFDQPRTAFRRFGITRELSGWLTRNSASFDGIFIHGVFDYPALSAISAAIRSRTRWILRPYGSLDHFDLRKHRVSKAVLGKTFIGPALRDAHAIWCTSRSEAERLNLFGAKTPVRVQSLPVRRWERDPARQLADRRLLGLPDDAPVVLFLSRIDPKKNLPNAIRALREVPLRGHHLAVAGSGGSEYVRSLQHLATELSVADRVHWLGWVGGATKGAVMNAADAFLLPSTNENFGLAAAEAVASGVPSVLTPGVFISEDVVDAGAALGTDGSPVDVARQIVRITSQSTLSAQLAHAGYRFWANHWQPEAIAKNLAECFLSD